MTQPNSAKFSRPWLGLWAANTCILVGLLVVSVTPAVFLGAVFLLFFIPEGIGLRRRGDDLPPLTYAIRRHMPRWVVDTMIFALGAWAAVTWSQRPHWHLILVIDAAIVGWLTNHFDVTYDGPGE